MATYPDPYGEPAIDKTNCTFGYVHNEMFGAFPTTAVGMEYLITEGNKMRPDFITETARPHSLGQFLGFQKYTSDMHFKGPISDIYRDTVLIQNDMEGLNTLVFWDYVQAPNYDMIFRKSNGTDYTGIDDYQLTLYTRPWNDPNGAWTLKESFSSYKSQPFKTGDGTIPDRTNSKSFLVEMIQVKRYGRCYGITNDFGQAVVASTDGTHQMDGTERLLFTSTVYGSQNISVADATGYRVIIYTREKQTSSPWGVFADVASYAGEVYSINFRVYDCKVEVQTPI